MNIGKRLIGYCDDYFNYYGYQNRIIVGEGYNWIVVIDDEYRTDFASFENEAEKIEMISQWIIDPEN